MTIQPSSAGSDELAGRRRRLAFTVDLIGRAIEAGRSLASIFPLEKDCLPKAREIVEQRLALLNTASYEFKTTFHHDLTAVSSAAQASMMREALEEIKKHAQSPQRYTSERLDNIERICDVALAHPTQGGDKGEAPSLEDISRTMCDADLWVGAWDEQKAALVVEGRDWETDARMVRYLKVAPAVAALYAAPQPASIAYPPPVSIADALRKNCGAANGCSCADLNYQWYGEHCEATMTSVFRSMLKEAAASPLPSGGAAK